MALGLSLREFARRDGCSDTLVRKAIKGGYLNPLSDGTLDEGLVGSPWRATNRGNVAREPGLQPIAASAATMGGGSRATLPGASAIAEGETPAEAAQRLVDELGAPLPLAEAERVKENYLALLRKLEFETKSAALVPMSAVETKFFNTARESRDAWVGWAPRIATEAAAELGLEARSFTEVLNRYVQQHLAELGVPDFDLG